MSPEQFNHDKKMSKLFLEFNWKNDALHIDLGRYLSDLKRI